MCSAKRIPVQRAGHALIQEVSESLHTHHSTFLPPPITSFPTRHSTCATTVQHKTHEKKPTLTSKPQHWNYLLFSINAKTPSTRLVGNHQQDNYKKRPEWPLPRRRRSTSTLSSQTPSRRGFFVGFSRQPNPKERSQDYARVLLKP